MRMIQEKRDRPSITSVMIRKVREARRTSRIKRFFGSFGRRKGAMMNGANLEEIKFIMMVL